MKKTAVIILVIIMIATPAVTASAVNPYSLGDVNGDGNITTADYLMIKKSFNGSTTLSPMEKNAADINKDGLITTVDYLRLKQYFAGKYDLNDTELAKIFLPYTEEDPLMQSMVILTNTGRIIVIDGGIQTDGSSADYLFTFLARNCGLKKQNWTIDTWFFTHAHTDHIKEFVNMTKLHSNIKINKIVCDLIDEDYIMSMPEYEHEYTYVLGLFNEQAANFNVEIPQVGDTYVIDDLTFEILKTFRTPENKVYDNINDTSMVFRMTGGGKSLLILGDLGVEGGKDLVSMYGDNLKSDGVQMAHHGQRGVNKACYEKINPSICLWPTPKWVWNNTPGDLETLTVRGWMDDLGVQKHFTMWGGWLDGNVREYVSFPDDF